MCSNTKQSKQTAHIKKRCGLNKIAMNKEQTINELLKYSKIIGKQPEQQQKIEIENAVKIALRVGFEAGIKFKEKE